jgi:NitT/TauT family transport system substrate-binding protein
VSQRGFWDSCFVEFAQREGFFREEKLDVEFFCTDGGAAIWMR